MGEYFKATLEKRRRERRHKLICKGLIRPHAFSVWLHANPELWSHKAGRSATGRRNLRDEPLEACLEILYACRHARGKAITTTDLEDTTNYSRNHLERMLHALVQPAVPYLTKTRSDDSRCIAYEYATTEAGLRAVEELGG